MRSDETVLHLMTEPALAIDIREPAGAVLQQFAAYPVHHMPVVDGRQVVGMLSSADLMKLDAFLPRKGEAAVEYLNRHMSIAKLMRRPAICVGAHQTVADAASLMASNGIHALPVVDVHNQLLGIITTTDIMHAALHSQRANAGRDAPNSPAQSADGAERRDSLIAVLDAAERYLCAGQDEQLHTQLTQAVDHARRLLGRETNLLGVDAL